MDIDVVINVSTNLALYIHEKLPSPSNIGEEGKIFKNIQLKIMDIVISKGTQHIDVNFNKAELWMLRDIAKTNGVIGNENVGSYLLHEVIKGILYLEAQDTLHQVIITHGENNIDEKYSKLETKEKLINFKE